MFFRGKDMWGILSFVGILLLGSHSALAWCDDTQKKMPLYDRLGGLATISVVISDFIDIIEHDVVFNANPIVGDAMKGVSAPYLKYQMTAFVCQAAGGPCLYRGWDMKESHAHLGIKELEWSRMTALFSEVLITNQVPEKERQELLKMVNSVKADIVDHSQG
ncbi:MAG: group 1 truncated hemoglobin [Porticoccus sp.]